jgi:hypothetical protein
LNASRHPQANTSSMEALTQPLQIVHPVPILSVLLELATNVLQATFARTKISRQCLDA